MRQAVLTIAAATAVLAPALAIAQVPAGGDFQVSTYRPPFTIGTPGPPSLAAAANGDFVIAWSSFAQDGNEYGVFGRRFAASGVPLGPEFQLNVATTGLQFSPQVAAHGSGRFLVAWHEMFGASNGTWARLYSREGTGAVPFPVHVASQVGFGGFGAGLDAAGRSVVARHGRAQDASEGVLVRRFDAAGAALGAEFKVNTSVASASTVDVAVAPGGAFVVVWERYAAGSGTDIMARRMAGDGTPQGDEFRVNTYTTSSQRAPSVAMADDASYVVVWQSLGQDGSGDGVFGQRFDASGVPRGGEFQVNTFTTAYQAAADVAADRSGNFVVAWSGVGPGSSAGDVFARRYDADGAPRGPQVLVNASTADRQWLPRVASDPQGNFVVSWRSGQDDDYSVFARRFGGLLPAALDVDAGGNRVLEPGEAVAVEPSWRNVNGAARTFSGLGTALSGPPAPGVSYTLSDGSGDYGTVADGAVGRCTDCYAVGIGFAGTRPATHWDAALTEAIVPDALGQHATWPLHVGESFADVPRTSPYYGFVETLLHRGVTGGCSGTAYCPLSATAREQMAVFVLVGKEGPGYLPPACGGVPIFDDVPAASPFCRWIEELARRGIAGGCGGGSYCPAAPVTREQMAVFVLRTLDGAIDPPACAAPNLYADVPETSPYCRWIEELTRRGVVTGCGGGNFCPGAAVTREQVAVFVTATFALTLYGP